MIVQWIVVLIIGLNFLYAQDSNTTNPVVSTKPVYLNILSNVNNTTIYLNGDMIGKTPIYRYELKPDVDYFAYAFADKRFYVEDLHQVINIKKNTIPTVRFDFQKAKAKVFLVGEDGELFINNKFAKELHARNRVFLVDAGENIKFRIQNGYKEGAVYVDLYADSFTKIHYKLIEIPLDIRLYTKTIENEMWEDTKEATNTPIEWEKAKNYCEDLRIGGFSDWTLPTVEQLKNLYENHNEKIYNGFGGVFYWSNEGYAGKNNIWQYVRVVNTEDGRIARSIQEFKEGRVRCVRLVDKEMIVQELPLDQNTTTPPSDQNITQNLERFLLK